MDFPDKIKLARTKLNISQETLSKKLGVSFATVNRWEAGKNMPNYRAVLIFEKFCKESGVDFNE